jgi:hypothetical protein
VAEILMKMTEAANSCEATLMPDFNIQAITQQEVTKDF